MDDRELMQLARMALEAEDLENGGAAHAPLKFPGASPAHVRAFRFAGGLIAAAACLAGAIVGLAPRPAPNTTAVRPLAENPGGVLPEINIAKQAEKCVLLAVFRTADGSCDCVQMRQQQWEGGKRLAEVGRAELVNAVMKSASTNEANRVVVVALSAPAGVDHDSAEAAERIATRIASAPAAGPEAITPWATGAMPALPPGTTVVAKSLAMGR